MFVLACADSPAAPATPDLNPGFAKAPPEEGTGTIQIVRGGTAHGTITSRPEGINCTIGPDGPTGTCEATFPAGTRVRLRAEAAPNSKFDGWAPVTSCTNPKNLTVRAGATISCQPVFSFTESPIFLLQAGIEGSGQVTSSPAGIDCVADADAGTLSGQCGNTFENGSTVTLTATPAAGWTFSAWTGEDPDCGDGVVTMNAAKRCVAIFVRV